MHRFVALILAIALAALGGPRSGVAGSLVFQAGTAASEVSSCCGGNCACGDDCRCSLSDPQGPMEPIPQSALVVSAPEIRAAPIRPPVTVEPLVESTLIGPSTARCIKRTFDGRTVRRHTCTFLT